VVVVHALSARVTREAYFIGKFGRREPELTKAKEEQQSEGESRALRREISARESWTGRSNRLGSPFSN
jgi:hypothetical protein